MIWLHNRLNERTSQAALAAAISQIAMVASQPAAWSSSGLVQWLTLIQPLAVCLLAFLIPEGNNAPPGPR